MITVSKLTKTFTSGTGVVTALSDISFEIPQGQFVTITGRSGSGKSTLLYQLGLLDHPTSGDIMIQGVNASALTTDERTAFRLNELGYVFQDYAILPTLTALENVLVPLLMQGMPITDATKKATDALVAVGLGQKLHNKPAQLSGGQQQRVAIARAIGHDPKILFADEPTANLDSETSDSVLRVFLDLHKKGQTIVMVTHEPEYALLGDRIITLADGKLVKDELVRK